MRLIAFTLALGLLAGHAFAAAPATQKEPTAQQSKMGACNKEAGDKKGDERKKFMSECLKKDHAVSQQDKMKACNVQAKDKKGDERRKFMSECLKKDKAA